MAKLVGVTGVQGGGKTTLLNSLKSEGWAVDNFKVSRAVQLQLGWDSLEKVMESVDTMQYFQEEVFKQKLKRDFELRRYETGGTFLTERTFADITAYTSYWCWEHVDRGNWSYKQACAWLSPFISQCRQAQRECYDAVILIPWMRGLPEEHDPHRASPSFREAFFDDALSFVRTSPIPYSVLSTLSVNDRVAEAIKFLETI
jgi:hypothetical protein